MSKDKAEKSEILEKKILNYKNEIYDVIGAFSHPKRLYITIDVRDSNGNPYTICDSNDSLYQKIQKIKVNN